MISQQMRTLLGVALFLILCFKPSGGEALEGMFYPNPGVIAVKGDGVIGSDHLYNLTDDIGIAVEIFKPKEVNLPFTDAMLKDRVVEIFKKAGLNPLVKQPVGKTLHPFFHVLIMLNPIEDGYVAYCQGRLFEKIELSRVKLAEQTSFQSITWETSNLIVSPTAEITKQINSCVDDLAKAFTERYNFFENIRSDELED